MTRTFTKVALLLVVNGKGDIYEYFNYNLCVMKCILNKGSNIVKITMKVISINGLSISSIYQSVLYICTYVYTIY